MIHILIIILSIQVCAILPINVIKMVGYIFCFLMINSLLYFLLDVESEGKDDKDEKSDKSNDRNDIL